MSQVKYMYFHEESNSGVVRNIAVAYTLTGDSKEPVLDYGAAIWKHENPQEAVKKGCHFSKKKHRVTAEARLKKRPVHHQFSTPLDLAGQKKFLAFKKVVRKLIHKHGVGGERA